MTTASQTPNSKTTRRATKKARTQVRQKRVYQFISDTQRKELLALLEDPAISIKQASRLCNIPYENAKLINRVYKNEGRTKRLKQISLC